MTPITIIKSAAGEGVTLVLTPTGTIKATGKQEVVQRWLPLIREHKPVIVVALQEAELVALVNLIADYNAFSAEDRQEALEIALGDPDAALNCFRALAARLPVARCRTA